MESNEVKHPFRRITRAEARLSFTSQHPTLANEPVKVRAKRKTKPKSDKLGETSFSTSLRKSFDKLYGVWKVRLMRNNNGRWQDRYGNWITYGLGVGSSDNIGWRTLVITPEMIGKKVAVFVAIEAKTDADESDDDNQNTFLTAVQDAGGIALIANAANGEQLIIDRINAWQPGCVYQSFPAPALPSEELPF